MVARALVTSRLCYCNGFYMGLPQKITQQLIYSTVSECWPDCLEIFMCVPVLQATHWVPTVFWAQFKVLVITYRSIGFGTRLSKILSYPTNVCIITQICQREPSQDSTIGRGPSGGHGRENLFSGSRALWLWNSPPPPPPAVYFTSSTAIFRRNG